MFATKQLCLLLLLVAAVMLQAGLMMPDTLYGRERGTVPVDDGTQTITQQHPEVETRPAGKDQRQITSSEAWYATPHYLEPENGVTPQLRPEPEADSWMIYLVMLGLGTLALARYFFPVRLKMLIQSVFGLRFFIQLDKEGTILRETPDYLLKLNFLVCISLLVVQSIRYYSLDLPWDFLHPALIFGAVFVFFALFYLLKNLFLRFLAWIFDTNDATRAYFNNILVFNHFTGLILLPLVFYQAFNPLSQAIPIAWGLVVLVNIYKILRGVILGHSMTDFSVYYLFLYLCGVELAPLLIIGKAAYVHLF